MYCFNNFCCIFLAILKRKSWNTCWNKRSCNKFCCILFAMLLQIFALFGQVLQYIYYNQTLNHIESIERKSPYKESYTVNSHWKIFNDVGTCVKFWNSKLFHSFSIFSIDFSYIIFSNKAGYVFNYKRISKQQSR